jgi:uncharacterized protein
MFMTVHRITLGALFATVVCLPVSARPTSRPEQRPAAEVSRDAAPALITTEGQAPQWRTVEELAAAAEKGVPLACFQYAQLLEKGDQIPQNPTRAVAFYRKAAEAGQADALFRLGKIHHDGLLGMTVDYATAIEYYRRAAAAGVPEAMYNIGSMLVSARGVKRDYVAGLAWLIVAGQRGAAAEAGIHQVRQRLARQPQLIATAEQRAAVLTEALQSGGEPQLDGTIVQAEKRAVEPPHPEAARPKAAIEVERPRSSPTPPSVIIEKSTINVPIPAPTPSPKG